MLHLPAMIVLRTHCAGKAGADVLFEDPARKSSTLGVTVNPIRVDSLEAFGDLDAVASRLLQAEKAKVRQGSCFEFPVTQKLQHCCQRNLLLCSRLHRSSAIREPCVLLSSHHL